MIGTRDCGGSLANALSRKDVGVPCSFAWGRGKRRTIAMRPASDSATHGSVTRSAKPVSRNRPQRGLTSTAVLMARTRPGARWISSMTAASRLRIKPTGSTDAALRAHRRHEARS